MTDFQDALNKLLSSPEDMEKLTALAGQFLGGGSEPETPEPSGRGADFGSIASAISGMDPALLGKITKLMSVYSGKSDKAALIEAISPYIDPERQSRLAKAQELAKYARVAKAALGEFGGNANA